MSDEYITLIPWRDSNNNVQWTMIYKDHYGGPAGYPDIDLGNNGQAKFLYTIVDPNKLGITFDPTPVPNSQPQVPNAIWVGTGSASQKVPGVDTKEIIHPVKLQKGNTQLKFTDKNDNSDVLTYQLNFINPSNPTEKVTVIDPEIRNGGGGIRPKLVSNAEAAALILSLAVLGLVALLWVNRFRDRRQKV